jgi:4-amino-4-deoxy-L-arabinose transferase-like glycosyltransferase
MGSGGVHGRAALGVGCLVALVAGALFFQGLGAYPLWDPDEARHAQVAREMAGGQGLDRLVAPTLGLRPYHEKPPGWYWLVSAAYATAGVGPAAARGVSAAAALVVVLALYAWALPRAGVAGAAGAALVLATSGWFLLLARYANLDMALTACVTVAVLSGLAWLERPPPRRPPRLPWVAAALGVLVKGPLALVLVGAPLGAAALMRRPLPRPSELGLLRGAAVLALVAGSVYLVIAVREPAYFDGLVATHHARFGEDAVHPEPFWYYLVWLPLLVLPWTPFVVPAVAEAIRDPARRPLVAWAALVPALFTLADAKLATYMLPALPPLALLVGPHLARIVRDGADALAAPWVRAGGWLGLLLLGGAAVAPAVLRGWYPVPATGIAAVAVAALLWATVLAVTLRGGRLERVPLLALGAVLTLHPLIGRLVVPGLSTVLSDAAMARCVPPGTPVIAFAGRAYSLTFYTGAPVIDTGDPEVARDLFEAHGLVLLATGRKHYAEVEALLGPRAHVWHGTWRRRLYGNRPPPD